MEAVDLVRAATILKLNSRMDVAYSNGQRTGYEVKVQVQ